METKSWPTQPGPWRGGQGDPGRPPNWFICQIIRGKEGISRGHGLLCRRCVAQALGTGPGGVAGSEVAVTASHREKLFDFPFGTWSETKNYYVDFSGRQSYFSGRQGGAVCHCSFPSRSPGFWLTWAQQHLGSH